MASFQRLLKRREEPVMAVFEANAAALESRDVEGRAATKIQSVARMRRVRLHFSSVVLAICTLQRTYRGFCGRKKFLDRAAEKAVERRAAVFNYYATVIQRIFRGFFSRKWRGDFYSQKRYLMEVEKKSQAVRAMGEELRQEQDREIAEKQARKELESFRSCARSTHHLVSTVTRGGVLRPALAATGLTTTFGTDVEDELRVAAAADRKARKFKKDLPAAGTSPDSTGSPSHSPARGAGVSAVMSRSKLGAGPRHGAPDVAKGIDRQPYSKALSNSCAYDAVDEGRRLENAVHRRLVETIHAKPFVSRKPSAPPPAPLLHGEVGPRPTLRGVGGISTKKKQATV